MKKAVKITLIAAGAVVLSGAAISAAAISMGAGRSVDGVSRRTETISDKISSLSVKIDYDDIDIIPCDTDKISVRCVEGKTKKYNIISQNGTLTVENAVNGALNLKWYEYINFNFWDDEENHKVVINVPRSSEVDLNINNSYGDVNVSGVKGSLNAQLDCGDIEIEGCSFDLLDCVVNYGDIEIKRTSAQSIKADNDCGDIDFEDVEGNITSECDLGDIEFEYVSGDNLIFNNDCGDIEGVIRGKRADYESGGAKKLEAKSDMGDVRIRFTEQ